MKKSQLKNIIRESIKELINEQPQGKPPTCYACANNFPNYVLANDHPANNNQYTIQGNIAMGYSTPTIISGPSEWHSIPPDFFSGYIYPSNYWQGANNPGNLPPNMIGNNPCNSMCELQHFAPVWGNMLYILGCTDPSYVANCEENQPWCPNGTITQSDPNWGSCLECNSPSPWNNITGTDCECCDHTPVIEPCKKCCCEKGDHLPIGEKCAPGTTMQLSPTLDPCECPQGTIEVNCKSNKTDPILTPDEPTTDLEPTPDPESKLECVKDEDCSEGYGCINNICVEEKIIEPTIDPVSKPEIKPEIEPDAIQRMQKLAGIPIPKK